jgi:hypothetical protein
MRQIILTLVLFFSILTLGCAAASVVQVNNGNFSDGLNGWKIEHGSNVNDTYNVTVVDEPGNEKVLDFWRENSFDDGGTIRVTQVINAGVSGLSTLKLSADVKVISHTLMDTGWWCEEHKEDVNCKGESPIRIWVYYNDADGKQHLWQWGFIESDYYNKTTYDYVNTSEWHHFVSQNLMGLEPKPHNIVYIAIGGNGWDYHGRVDNITFTIG